MKKMIRQSVLAVGVACSALTANVMAEASHGQRYMGASVGFLDIDLGSDSPDAGVNHLEGRLGGYFNDYLAAEGRLGLGVVGDTISGVDVDLRYLVGAYLRAGVPVADNKLFPYVLLGFTRVDVEASAGGIEVNEAETDTSLGFGVDVGLGNLSLSAEYVSYVDKNDAGLSGFTIGLKTNF